MSLFLPSCTPARCRFGGLSSASKLALLIAGVYRLSALELSSINAISRVDLDEARARPGQIEAGSEFAWLNGANLAQ
ncbi:hypothetical protein [Bradyrhizobium nanningense]|uniref:hypothetical protein n=1 Tax=Bradyrhizobium nanningense TaxID=1325118 RepID=UPI0013E8BE03|nr:hypothetical protein [Bradyrhizobium nanningense]